MTFLELIKTYFVEPVEDLLFPPVCFFCDTRLPQGRYTICEECWNSMPVYGQIYTTKDAWQQFDDVYILFNFEEKIRSLIHLLKYQRHLTLAKYFALAALNNFPELKSTEYDYICAVPLHPVKKRERGYNQSQEIATVIAKNYGIPILENELKRIRNTKTQTKLNREERMHNVEKAFVCLNNLSGKKILLVDDVITTGSTASACASSLKRAGAVSVDLLAVSNPLPGNDKLDLIDENSGMIS